MSATVYQTSHDLMCQSLRKVLVDGAQVGGRDATGGIGSVRCRVSAALYALLMAHPVDREGRCRSCRRPGAVLGWRRRCWVHIEASYWLRQPEEFLRSRVVQEWGLADQSPPGPGAAGDRESATSRADSDGTDVLPRIDLEPGDPPTQPLQSPAVSSAFAPQGFGGVRQQNPAHGGPGDGPVAVEFFSQPTRVEGLPSRSPQGARRVRIGR